MSDKIITKPSSKIYRDRYEEIDWKSSKNLNKYYDEGFDHYHYGNDDCNHHKPGSPESEQWYLGFEAARMEE